jgi:hypothetical protein
MKNKRRNILLFFFFSSLFLGAGEPEETGPPEQTEAAAEADAEAAAEAEADTPLADPESAVHSLDIKTSTLTELASWCRTLGLSDAGGREEMARRLRDYYGIGPPSYQSSQAEGRVITIESAQSSEYFTLEAVDEEYARLRGNVVVSFREGNATHRITAGGILFNRTRNIMNASGGVEYVREQEDSIETFKGDSITVNLDDWSGFFLGGYTERGAKDDETAYRFTGTVISRTGDDVTVLTDAEISNAKNADSLWSLKASKIWLLPGSDFAMFNAVLKVGEIPVLYIPFFHIPADEVIFHPVLGYRSREGSFVQTTTYLLGRPKASSASESSISRILGGSGETERKRDGIFLRSTGRKVKDTSEPTLKTIFDLYAKLGFYLGTDLTLPRMGILDSLDLSTGLGFSRTIIKDNDVYSPFGHILQGGYPDYDGRSDWNRSLLFSSDVPFRYRFKSTGSFSGEFGSFSWDFPHYSDPYTDRDFLQRTEEMDWMHIVQEGASIMDEESTESLIDNYEWRFSGSIKLPPSNLEPYISTLTLSGISSAITFRSRDLDMSDPSWREYSPMNKFFFPDKYTIYSLNATIAGTPFSLTRFGVNSEEPETLEDIPDPRIRGTPLSPWPAGNNESAKKAAAGLLLPPALDQSFDLPSSGGPRFSIDYTFSPSSASEMQWQSAEVGTNTNWQRAMDVDWNEVSSVLSIMRGDGGLGFTLDHTGGGAYTTSMRFTGTGAWQDYVFLNDDAEEFATAGALDTARARNYNSTYFTTSFEYLNRFAPFYRSSVWGDTNLTYGAKGLMARSEFTGTGSEPEWKVAYGAWDRDNLESHQIAANIAARIMEQSQTLVLSVDLPPEEIIVSGNGTARIWVSETNTNMKFFPEGREETDDTRYFDYLYSTETLRFTEWWSLQQYMIYDPHIKAFNTLTTTLTLGGLSASFTSVRMLPYRLNTSPVGWVTHGTEGLYFRDFTLAYVKSYTSKKFWDERLSFAVNVNTSLNVDLQRFTYSQFRFTLGLGFNITNFLDITFSANSENSLIYRYLQAIPYFRLPDGFPILGEQNVFKDLINSFRFDDPVKRASSGFKLKSFKLEAVHHLGDWNAKLGFTMSPYLPTGGTRYLFNNEVSFIVQWVPIKEIKTDIGLSKDEWVFK